MEKGGCTLPPKRSCLLRRRHRLLARVLQGLPASPQPSVLRMPAATPHLLPSSAVARLSNGWGRSAVAPTGDTAIKGLSHRSPQPYTHIIPHFTQKVNPLWKIFLTDLDVSRLNFPIRKKGRFLSLFSQRNLASCPKSTFVSSKTSPVCALTSTKWIAASSRFAARSSRP